MHSVYMYGGMAASKFCLDGWHPFGRVSHHFNNLVICLGFALQSVDAALVVLCCAVLQCVMARLSVFFF